jgi:predicted nucleic acid-binding protein
MDWIDWIPNSRPPKRNRPHDATAYYLDTSALAKLYVKETGSRELSRWIGNRDRGFDPDVRLYTSRLTLPETISALTRKRINGTVPASEGGQLWLKVFRDFGQEPPVYEVIEPSFTVVGRAAFLVAQHGLRAYDAVQLASALWLQPRLDDPGALVFVSADKKLTSAAQAERLATADPTPVPPPPPS